MAITQPSSAIPGTNTTLTSYTITIPTVAVGDLLVLFVNQREPDTDPGAPTDNDSGTWNKVAGGPFKFVSAGVNLTMWWRRATSATSAKTISHTMSSAVSVSAVLLVFTGALSSATPVVAVAQESNASGNETHAAFTPPEADCAVGIAILENQLIFPGTFACATHGASQWGGSHWSSGGNDTTLTVPGWTTTTATSTGAFTWTQTDGPCLSVTFYIRPEPVAAGGKPAMYYHRMMRG